MNLHSLLDLEKVCLVYLFWNNLLVPCNSAHLKLGMLKDKSHIWPAKTISKQTSVELLI